MSDEFPKLNCPVCNGPLSPDNKHWVVICGNCQKAIQITVDEKDVFSMRQYIYPPGHSIDNVEIFVDYVEKHLPLVKWGFSKTFHPQKSGLVIYDSEFCRVKFELSVLNYFPLYETIIYYGRLHAPDNEKHITWNGEKCLSWHSNIHITIPFIERISAQQLAEDRHGEIWQSLVDDLQVDYPRADHLEYPLRLHAKIWQHYEEKLFSIFDLRNLKLWEEYSKYSNEYNELLNSYFHERYKISRNVEKIC